METRRRSRILLKAALGSAGQDGVRGCHRRLELSDDSETSDSPSVHHSEASNSLRGVGTHYDHSSNDMGWKVFRKKSTSQPRMSTVDEVPFTLDTRRISASSSTPIGNHSQNSGRNSIMSTGTDPQAGLFSQTDSLNGKASPTTINSSNLKGSSSTSSDMDVADFEEAQEYQMSTENCDMTLEEKEITRQSSSSSHFEAAVAGEKRISASSVPLLSKLTEGDASRHSVVPTNAKRGHQRKKSSSRPQTAPNQRNRLTSSSSTSKKKKRHRVQPASLPTTFDTSTDGTPSPSPRLSFFLPPKPPQTEPHHSKRNQVHPVSNQHDLEHSPAFVNPERPTSRQKPKTEEPFSKPLSSEEHLPHQVVIEQDSSESIMLRQNSRNLSGTLEEHFHLANASSGTSSTKSRQFSASVSETSRSSVSSVLTPLFTSSLRMRGSKSSSETKWELGGDSQLTSCFPDRTMRIFIVTWNMQEIKVCRPKYSRISNNKGPISER